MYISNRAFSSLIRKEVIKMKRKFPYRIIMVFATLALLIGTLIGGAVPVSAATSQNVTITSLPQYLDISNSPGTWTLNDLTGDGTVLIDTIYYANPLGDTTPPSATVTAGECQFDLTNNSTVDTDITVNVGNFTGGSDPMTNSDDGTNGVGVFGAHSWYAGLTYASKVIAKTAASTLLKDEHTALTNLDWGAEVETQTDAWAGGTSSTSTMTISIAVD